MLHLITNTNLSHIKINNKGNFPKIQEIEPIPNNSNNNKTKVLLLIRGNVVSNLIHRGVWLKAIVIVSYQVVDFLFLQINNSSSKCY